MADEDDLRYMRVASLVFGQPLLITAEAAEAVGTYLRARMEGETPKASRFVGEQQVDLQSGRWKGYRLAGNVGVISIMGELVNRGAWMGASSGLTSYEGIIEQVRQAAADPAVQSFLLDIQSPGGEAFGMVDAARQIRALTAGRQLVAIANSVAASAAYGLASVADQLVVNEGGVVGSIGVVMMHLDQSKMLESKGVKATVITTGSKKALGHSAVPITEEGLAVLKARAERVMSGFASLVAEHRPNLTLDAIYALEGDIFVGSDAVAAGLADRTGTFDSVLADLNSARGRVTKGKSMETPNGAPAAEHNAGTFTQAHVDAAVASATASAATQTQTAVDAAVAADRQRVAGLDALLTQLGNHPKAGPIINAAKADGSSVDATKIKLFDAGVLQQASTLAALQGDDASATGAKPAAAGNGAPAAAAQTPEGWKAEWEASADLQNSYPKVEHYVSLKKAEAAGRVRVLGAKAK